jgi:hypothetical protein
MESGSPDLENTPERLPRVFEYKGRRSLKIRGITGRLFYFRYPGHKITVPYEDAFALMAETYLEVHPRRDDPTD